MGKYRKKPVEVEAWRLRGDNADLLAAKCGGRVRRAGKPSDPADVAVWVDIPTLEGVMTANAGDWIIKGVQGEFYPCKPDIFTTTYDEVMTG